MRMGGCFQCPFVSIFFCHPFEDPPHFLSGLVALAQLTDYYEESMVNNQRRRRRRRRRKTLMTRMKAWPHFQTDKQHIKWMRASAPRQGFLKDDFCLKCRVCNYLFSSFPKVVTIPIGPPQNGCLSPIFVFWENLSLLPNLGNFWVQNEWSFETCWVKNTKEKIFKPLKYLLLSNLYTWFK